jgi:RNA polymerase sigma factor (sigma-70 family)
MMPSITLGSLVQELGWVQPAPTRLPDGELLEQFIQRRDEDAFAALMRSHGPMVLGVCRRILRNEAEVEDAFQATFLVLIKKAAAVQPRHRVGNWLYGVACTTALKARAMSMKRKTKEQQAVQPHKSASEDNEVMLAQLDQELRQLPDIYRTVIVLCELEGRTIKQVAEELGCPPGTISARLARGRRLLAERLTRSGRAITATTVGALLSQTAVQADMPAHLLKASVVSPEVQALAQGVMRTMLLTKLQAMSVALLLVILLGSAVTGAAAPENVVGGPAQLSPVQPLQPRKSSHFVYTALFLPDGKRIVVSEGEDQVRIYDVATNKPGSSFKGATKSVRTLALSPDGKMLAGGSNDGNVYVWDVATQKLLYQDKSNADLILTVAFSPDGSKLAVAGHLFTDVEERSLSVLDARTGHLQMTGFLRQSKVPLNAGTALVIHPNSKELALVNTGKFTGISFHGMDKDHLLTQNPRIEYEAPLAPQSLAYSPDGKLLACGGVAPPLPDPNNSRLFGSPMGNLKIWDAQTGKLVKTLFDDSDGDVKAITFSSNGKKLYVVTTMKMGDPVQTPNGLIGRLGASCQCWDTEKWSMDWDTRLPGGMSFTLALSPDQQKLLLTNTAGCWLIDDLVTGKHPRQLADTSETPPVKR